ncbi:MAG: hypothetical protein ACI8XU_001245 [Kiritimatiellia bacterium]|jgi:hypothetical protein
MPASSTNRMLKPPLKAQRGVILLLMMFAVLLVGLSIFISALSNNEVSLRQQRNTTDALSGIKESLISYSVLYADYYGVASAGPGHLMCPDTDGDGVENEPCAADSLGRLPISMTLPSGDIFPLSSYESGIDQQIWYALSDDFRRNPVAALNTATVGNLSLDGLGGIAAVLIAPAEIVAAQTRVSNSSSDYLEAGNVTAPDFVSFNQLDPANFNDRVLPIRLTEIFSPVTARVAEVIRIQLDDYHAISGVYPANQNDFEDVLNGIVPAGGGGGGGKGGGGKGGKGGGGGGGGVLNPMPAWFLSNDWFSVSNYTSISNDSGSVDFTNCNITYTLNFAVSSLGKAGSSC